MFRFPVFSSVLYPIWTSDLAGWSALVVMWTRSLFHKALIFRYFLYTTTLLSDSGPSTVDPNPQDHQVRVLASNTVTLVKLDTSLPWVSSSTFFILIWLSWRITTNPKVRQYWCHLIVDDIYPRHQFLRWSMRFTSFEGYFMMSKPNIAKLVNTRRWPI